MGYVLQSNNRIVLSCCDVAGYDWVVKFWNTVPEIKFWMTRAIVGEVPVVLRGGKVSVHPSL